MKQSCFNYLLMGVAALAIAALPLQAADKPESAAKAEGKAKKETGGKSEGAKAIPFNGTLKAKSGDSITVGERTFQVTSETKIKKDGKPAVLADGEVGKEVAGQYREEGGKMVAKSIRFGPKPESKEGAEKPKADKEKKDKKEKKETKETNEKPVK